VKVRKINEKAK